MEGSLCSQDWDQGGGASKPAHRCLRLLSSSLQRRGSLDPADLQLVGVDAVAESRSRRQRLRMRNVVLNDWPCRRQVTAPLLRLRLDDLALGLLPALQLWPIGVYRQRIVCRLIVVVVVVVRILLGSCFEYRHYHALMRRSGTAWASGSQALAASVIVEVPLLDPRCSTFGHVVAKIGDADAFALFVVVLPRRLLVEVLLASPARRNTMVGIQRALADACAWDAGRM